MSDRLTALAQYSFLFVCVFLGAAAASLVDVSLAVAQAPTQAQEKCLVSMNRNGVKLVRSQLKATVQCIKNAGIGRSEGLGLPSQTQNAQACLTNDIKGTIAKAKTLVAEKELKDCLAGPEQLPPWSYESSAIINVAGADEPLLFAEELFGDDLDVAIVDADTDKFGSKCQQTVIKDASKLFEALWKEALKAMRRGLKCSRVAVPGYCAKDGIAPLTTGDEFETFAWGSLQADVKQIIAKKAAKIGEKAAKICDGAATPLASMFPGVCAGEADAAGLGACLEEIVRRRQCRTMNDFDLFFIDCGGTPDEIILNPTTLNMLTREDVPLSVSLNTAAGPAGFEVTLESDTPGVASVQATLNFTEGERTKDVDISSSILSGSAVISASAADTIGDMANVNVALRTFTLESPLVGVGRTVPGRIILDEVAPTGDAMFQMSTDDPATVTVDSPVFVMAGLTENTFGLSGHQTGFPTLTADGSADGFETVMLAIEATDRLVDLSSGETLAMGIPFILPVLIAPDPAPAGGVLITVETDDAGIVEVTQPGVTVPDGQLIGFGEIVARAESGSTNITASNFGYAPDVMPVIVESGLKIIESFSEFGEFDTDSIYLRLQQQGTPYPAPAGGASIDLVADDPACVTADATTLIPEAATFHTTTFSYGGSAALPCTTTVTASSPVYGTDTVSVTVGGTPDLGAITITNPFTGIDRLGAGLQQQMRATLASGAHGGVLLQIESDDPAVVLLAPDATTAGEPVIEVSVPDATTVVHFYAHGVDGAELGSANIVAQQTRFTDGGFTTNVEAAILDIVSLITIYNVDSTQEIADDPFFIRTGIAQPSGLSLQYEQPVSASAGPRTITLSNSDPTLAVMETAFESGTSIELPLDVNASRTPSSVFQGGVQLNFPHPPLSGTLTVGATASGFDPTYVRSSLDVEVNVSTPSLSVSPTAGPNLVGAGLQQRYRVSLSGADHGGVTVRVTTDNPAITALAPDTATVGAAFIDIAVPDQTSQVFFYAQGLVGTSGMATLTATEPIHTDGVRALDVVQPVADILSLSGSHNVDSTDVIADDEFNVRVGVPNAAGTAFSTEQEVSPELTAGLDVTLSSNDPGVAELTSTAATGASTVANIAIGATRSPTTVAAGGSAVRFPVPPISGTATIAATATGFDNTFFTADDDVVVTVTPASLTISEPFGDANDLGAGLQQSVRVTLSGASHGGVTVRVEADNTSLVAVAPDTATAGSTFLDVVVPNGTTFFDVTIQGIAGTTGTTTLRATEPAHTDGTLAVDVVAPVLDLLSIITSHSTVSTAVLADDPFNARSGVPNVAGTALATEQAVSAAIAAGIAVTFASNNTGIAEIATTGASGASQMATIPASQSRTPTSLATGGVAVRFPVPPVDGIVTVSASATGFDNGFAPASEDVDVDVTQASLTITSPFGAGDRLGAALQQTMRVTLSGSQHGGVTVRVTSDTPGVVTVAPDSTTAGTAFIDVAVANGTSFFDCFAQGIAGTTGSATLTATEAAHTDGNFAVEVVAPVLDLLSLITVQNTTAISTLADDPFNARSGIANVAGTAFAVEQEVSAAETSGIDITFASSATGIGEIATTGSSGASAVINLAAGASRTPTSLALGGAAVRFPTPPADGVTTVSASATGFNNAFDPADEDVTVNATAATITLTAPVQGFFEVGAGLQHNGRVNLNGPDHGGTTVRVAVADPNLARVSLTDSAAGTSFIDVVIADQATTGDFFIQGVAGQVGSVNLNGSAVGFVDGDETLDVSEPVLDILSLAITTTAGAADDPFQIRTGIATAPGTAFRTEQEVSPAGAVTVTVTSSDPATAQLVTTASTGASVMVTVAVVESRSAISVAAGGVALDPLAAGTTDITATATGFASPFDPADETVTVNP